MTKLQELTFKARESMDFAINDLTDAHKKANLIEQIPIWSALQDAHELRSMVAQIHAALMGTDHAIDS